MSDGRDGRSKGRDRSGSRDRRESRKRSASPDRKRSRSRSPGDGRRDRDSSRDKRGDDRGGRHYDDRRGGRGGGDEYYGGYGGGYGGYPPYGYGPGYGGGYGYDAWGPPGGGGWAGGWGGPPPYGGGWGGWGGRGGGPRRPRGPRGTEEERKASTCIWVGNLPYTATENDVRDIFERYAKLQRVTVPLDRTGSRNKGFAYVEFESRQDAEDAFDKVNGTVSVWQHCTSTNLVLTSSYVASASRTDKFALTGMCEVRRRPGKSLLGRRDVGSLMVTGRSV